MGSRNPVRSMSESEAAGVDGMEAWWEDFLKHQKEDEENVVCVENLRQVFEKERRIVERLFETISEVMRASLDQDKLNKGARLYDEWGKMRRKECLLSYYDNEYFRATYARKRFVNSATSFMQALHLRIIPETPGVEAFLSKVTRIISVGVGPGSDIAGFLAYSRSRGVDQRLVYYTLDQCPLWDKYIHAIDKSWSAEFKVSVWFKPSRFGKRDTVGLLPDADMLVFSFSNTSLMDPSIWPLLQARYPLIIVLDGVKEVLIDGFGVSEFIKFQLNERTNVYYSFRDPDKPSVPADEPDQCPDVSEDAEAKPGDDDSAAVVTDSTVLPPSSTEAT